MDKINPDNIYSTFTEEDAKSIEGFGKEADGSYSDRWQFSIINTHLKGWCLFFFDEMDGSTYFIKRLRSREDLLNLYEAITEEKLMRRLDGPEEKSPAVKLNKFNFDFMQNNDE